MTNKERIQSMDVIELADFLAEFIPCLCCDFDTQFCNRNCESGILEWLEREEEE